MGTNYKKTEVKFTTFETEEELEHLYYTPFRELMKTKGVGMKILEKRYEELRETVLARIEASRE